MSSALKWFAVIILSILTLTFFGSFVAMIIDGDIGGGIILGILTIISGFAVRILVKPKAGVAKREIVRENNSIAFENHLIFFTDEKTELKSSFEIKQLEGMSVQLLESLDIISETKSIDTLASRINFVNSIYEQFIKLRSSPHYQRQAQRGIDRYKELYYNKILQDYQFALLMNPNIEDLEKYYGQAIFKTFTRFVDSHEAQIKGLTRANAILKRKEDIIAKGYTAKQIFNNFKIPDYFNNIERIESIRKSYYQYKKPEEL